MQTYQHSRFEVLLRLRPSESEQLANNQLLYTNKTLTLNTVKDDVVEIISSYSLERCCNVKNLQDALDRSKPLLSLALKGFNSVMLYMDTNPDNSLQSYSPATQLIQMQLQWIDAQVKSENRRRGEQKGPLLKMKYCYIDLDDEENHNLLKQEIIDGNYIIANGFNRFMVEYTTLAALNSKIIDNHLKMDPKLLVMNISDGVCIDGYLYMVDLQQPLAPNPISSSFKSLQSLLDKIKSTSISKNLEINGHDCLLTHVLTDALIGRHHAMLFLNIEESPHDDYIPTIEKSIAFAQVLSSLQGFAFQNPSPDSIPVKIRILQDDNERLVKKLSDMEQCLQNEKDRNDGMAAIFVHYKHKLKQKKDMIDQMEQSALSIEHKHQAALQAISESAKSQYKRQLEQVTLSAQQKHQKLQDSLQDLTTCRTKLATLKSQVDLSQTKMTKLEKLVKEKDQQLVNMKNIMAKLERDNRQPTKMEMDAKMAKEIAELNRKITLLVKENHELLASVNSSKAAKEAFRNDRIKLLQDHKQAAQDQVKKYQNTIDGLNTTLQQKRQLETQLKQEIHKREEEKHTLVQQYLEQQNATDAQLYQLKSEIRQMKDDKSSKAQELEKQQISLLDELNDLAIKNDTDKREHLMALKQQHAIHNEEKQKLLEQITIYQKEVQDLTESKSSLTERLDQVTADANVAKDYVGKLMSKVDDMEHNLTICHDTLEKTKIDLQYEKQWSHDQSISMQQERATLLQWVALVKQKWSEQAPGSSIPNSGSTPMVLETHVPDSTLPATLRQHIPTYTVTSYPTKHK